MFFLKAVALKFFFRMRFRQMAVSMMALDLKM
jgi:hypothetical protein